MPVQFAHTSWSCLFIGDQNIENCVHSYKSIPVFPSLCWITLVWAQVHPCAAIGIRLQVEGILTLIGDGTLAHVIRKNQLLIFRLSLLKFTLSQSSRPL